MRIAIAGESALIIYFGESITADCAGAVARAFDRLQQLQSAVITDLIPSYTSLLVVYDCSLMDSLACKQWLIEQLIALDAAAPLVASVQDIEIPVYYGPEVAYDLNDVAEQTGLGLQEIVERHYGAAYNVYAVGFAPGFAYLGLTDARLRVNRKSTPRLKVPKGSVAIADNQTAVYPSVSPGGWQIIGRTPMELVDWESASISPFQVGSTVRFRPIQRAEYLSLGGTFDEL